MKRFEYKMGNLSLTDRFSSKKQSEEWKKLTDELNALGSEGWDLVGFHSFDLVGGITGNKKGITTIALWKREIV